MESTISSGLNMEEPIGWSSDEGLTRSRSDPSYADRFGAEERLRRRRRAKNPSRKDFEDGVRNERKFKSSSESDFEENVRNGSKITIPQNLRNWRKIKSTSERRFEESRRRRRRTESPSEDDSEESRRDGSKIKSPSEDDSEESRRKIRSSESGSEQNLHIRRRTKSLSESGSEERIPRNSKSSRSRRWRRRTKSSSEDVSEDRQRKIKSSSERGSEKNIHRRRKSRTEEDFEESILHKIKSSSRSSSERSLPFRRRYGTDSDSDTRLHFRDTERNLRSDGEGTRQRTRSNQARMTKTMWDKSVIRYVPLYRAALMGEWEVAETIFSQDSGAITSKITLLNETALHIAVGTGDNSGFVENLVNLMCKRSLPLTQVDLYGNTALAVAAIVGNVKAADILVGKNETLASFKNSVNYSPLHLAAKYGHRDMIMYLLSVTKDEWVFAGKAGARLLNFLITFDIYDVALDVLNRQPKLAVEQDQYGITALQMLAQKPNVFESGSELGFWRRLLHRCWWVVVEVLDAPVPMPKQHGDVENPPDISMNADSRGALYQLLTSICSARFRKSVVVPFMKNIRDTKRMQKEACKLVRRLCEEALNVGGKKCASLFSTSILSAARVGTLEVATEILRVYPYSIWFRDRRQCNIFQLAVLHRQEKIYNLIYQMTSHKHFAVAFLDKDDNNILHLAGELAPSDKISGAALQLQRELQWFKEVERLVQPSYRSMKNKEERTPRMVFSEEHEWLVHQGEKWMKITASSCTVVAALVATVAFTAVFTAPGGNNSERGTPILLHQNSFMVFAAADALALITSSASVMMFLGILTSRYSEDDFLKALPTKLIIGLLSLFISISSMVAAFSASLYLVLVHEVKWVWAPIILFALVPVVLSAMLQFPLLVEMAYSTYGRSIFGLQSREIIH